MRFCRVDSSKDTIIQNLQLKISDLENTIKRTENEHREALFAKDKAHEAALEAAIAEKRNPNNEALEAAAIGYKHARDVALSDLKTLYAQTNTMRAHYKSVLRGLAVDQHKSGLSMADVRDNWRSTSERFTNNFAYYSDISLVYETHGDLIRGLDWQIDRFLPSGTAGYDEWVRISKAIGSMDTIRVLAVMYLINAILTKPFPFFDQVGCRKCVSTRTIAAIASPENAEILDIATEHALYEAQYTKDYMIPEKAQSCIEDIQAWLNDLVGATGDMRVNWWASGPQHSQEKCVEELIKLRMQTVLMRDSFDICWVEQGAIFDPESMATRNDMTKPPGYVPSGIVKLCLFPALWRCDAPKEVLLAIFKHGAKKS